MRIIRRAEAANKVGLSSRTLDPLEAVGKFPKKIQLGQHSSGWIESEINDWIAARCGT